MKSSGKISGLTSKVAVNGRAPIAVYNVNKDKAHRATSTGPKSSQITKAVPGR